MNPNFLLAVFIALNALACVGFVLSQMNPARVVYRNGAVALVLLGMVVLFLWKAVLR